MMVSTMGDVTLADAIAKSKWGFLKGFNVSKAYEAIRKDAFADKEGKFGRSGLQNYIEKGYVPSEIPESVSETLNYYLSDAAISRAAGVLGKHDDEKLLWNRSRRYAAIFNPDTQFFQPKDSRGRFSTSFNPEASSGFTEATAWQYRFYLPHDADGLKKLYGGKQNFCSKVQEMLSFYEKNPSKRVGNDARFPKTFGLYWHSNQPVHHILWVAKRAGCNALADKYLRLTMDMLYTTKGWAGDEDNGEMSSWYVLSALGLYSLEGGKDELVLGSPAIKHATVQLVNGNVLTIATENQAKDHYYTQSVTWTPDNGTPRTITGNVIKFTDIMKGGTLNFKMGASPSPEP
jgi:predicted alpha-1,2-mannosidase